MGRFVLTAENYYSPEAAQRYYSASQIKQFIECEKAALADIRGEIVKPKTPALLVGGYIDAHFAGEMEQFRAANPEIFTKLGMLRSDYQKAEQVIERIERDPLAMALMEGEKQRIVTGMIGGFPFRAKLDIWMDREQCLKVAQEYPEMGELAECAGAIVDLKVMKDFEPMYRQEEGRISFIEYWRYDLQMAIYQALMRAERGAQDIPCYILAATKQDPPDLCLVKIPQELLDFNLEQLTKRLPDIDEVKRGDYEPDECGKCCWCRQTKRLSGPTIPGALMWG